MTTIKIELCSYSPLDLSSLNKKHDIKLHGAFVLSATEFIENDDNNNKEEKLKEQKSKRAKEQKNDDEEITW